ncbi:MAG TPA: ABC transporter ATP-binding protein [Acidobacteriaceae bacterium]|jgi:lipoprotein-releasing system ATP-binding protein|nr:ABC transporter ATP-binding protein [Acidobacteriaceae bacterium]
MSTPALLRASALEKTYPPLASGSPGLQLFRDLSLEVAPGEMVAIVGESGAGKSTLLHLLAALDTPTSGDVWCNSTHVTALSRAQAAVFRNREIGYVWQFHYLLPEFTALENIALPLLARGVSLQAALKAAETWLDRVGLAARAQNRSGELSGGEQQRVSIARALVTQPRLLLADEPTGDLDSATADRVFSLLLELHRDHSLTSILVTHNADFARRCDRILRLYHGQLQPE